MSRHFYLPPQLIPQEPKAESSPLWQKLRVSFTVVGVLAVTLLLWWYFTDDERWQEAEPPRSLLSSTSRDSLSSDPLAASPLVPGLQTSASGVVSNVLKTDSQAIARQALVARPVRLEIWNACGEKGLAQRVTSALRARGTYFDVRGMGNATTGKQDFSSILGRSTDSTLAIAIAESLGIPASHVATEVPRSPRDIDVTVIIGADYPRLRLGLKPN